MSSSYLEVTWTDDETGITGFVVIDRLSRGVAGGGLRMRKGVTIEEVRDLARGMTLKDPVLWQDGDRYVPFGGAKGGIDCDPYDPRARGVLGRWARAMKPLLDTCFATGEDFGVRQELIDEVFAEEGIDSCAAAGYRYVPDGAEAAQRREHVAWSVDVDGVGLPELVGGYGVAEAALAALEHRGIPIEHARAVVQGFGSMGGATARYLACAGVRVVGIADRAGLVHNADGLDVETLLLTRDEFGVVDRAQLRPGDLESPREQWLELDAEVLVPAAMSYVITADDVERIRASIVVEAANVATLVDAESELRVRGVTVVPDFVANTGTNQWWWWTCYGDVEPTADAAFAMLAARMRPLVHEILERSDAEQISPREAATRTSHEKRAQIDAHYPRTVKAATVHA
jgi:glutamate dehydrogenase (NAD(P)+)